MNISIELEEKTVSELLTILYSDQEIDLRCKAAQTLGKTNEMALPGLLVALRDPNQRIRVNAATALGKIGDDRAIEKLLVALNDTHWHVRARAAFALGEIGESRAVDSLLATLHDEFWPVRMNTADALGRIGDARAVDGLLAALHDTDWRVRWRAVWALGQIGNARAVSGLIELLGDKTRLYVFSHERICDHAAKALGQIATPEALAAIATWRQSEAGKG